MKIAAIYARVSGERQRDDNTIASQTEALIAYAEDHGYSVAPDMIIEDDGYTGAVLERPGLERVRDLAAEGRIDTVLVHAPDRLSRRYAYQVLLIEELARQGVETVFLRAPSMKTPEDHLLVQFQGMIAEYERAQILERSRRGKRHRARRGEIAVLGGAPYGYRYHKKAPDSDAFYEIVEPQASMVREVYRYYTCDHMSIGAITCRLNERAVSTSTGRSRWERSTVWAMLRNPAYKGKACFGKTRQLPRKCVTRPLRLRRGVASGTTGGHEKPREEWIEIPVPAIVSEETFALAEERLEMNKIHAPRRTKTPSVVQGLVSCGKCGYALSRTSARTSARKISYYRCLGSDSWRHLNGPMCDSRPVRQDLLDDVVWGEVVRLLEDPALIGAEIDRRLQAARASDPNQQRESDLRHRLIRVRKSIGRLVNAYQEELITIDELRDRTPELRRQEQALNRELQSAVDRVKDREIHLRLAETLTGFLARLRSSAETLDIAERQRIVRLIVKEVLVTEDKITIRHSIPISESPAGGPDPSKLGNDSPEREGYLLRSGRHNRALRGPPQVVPPFALFHDAGAEPLGDQPDDPAVPNPVLHEPKKPASINLVEVGPNVRIGYPVDLAPFYPECQGIERIVRATPGSEPIAEPEELRLEYRHKDGLSHRRLDDLVLQCSDAQRSCSPVRLRYLHPPGRKRPVPSAMNPVMQVEQSLFQPVAVFMPRHPVHACRSVLLQREVGHAERVRRDVVQKSSELLLRFPRGCLPYPLRRL